MAEETTRPLTPESTANGGLSATTRLTPAEDLTRSSMCIRPTTVVPIIFLPGIMGSNLRDATTKESVWNTNSTIAVLLQWIFRSSSTRQTKLAPDKAEVDDRGRWYGKSASIPDEKTGKQRKQGTTSRAFYGDFVRWLDNRLNDHSLASHEGRLSPWKPFEGRSDYGKTWGAQKPFIPIGPDESSNAWDNFFCPVHVHGYNWLKSNGEAGKVLAAAIDTIIAYWNTQKDCGYRCEKVILVGHSMGGLVSRAAVHPDFGNAADKVLGNVHGELAANGAAAAYHHCRNGYGGTTGWVLGRNAAQVSAVFANAPGAMELLPNQQYEVQGKKGWLKAQLGDSLLPAMQLPESEPYSEIYFRNDVWWRLMDPVLIDPAGKLTDPWTTFYQNVNAVYQFQRDLGKYYHPQTYVHYGADAEQHPAYNDLLWKSRSMPQMTPAQLLAAAPGQGSNPVTVRAPAGTSNIQFEIVEPDDVGYPQPGDETAPACSGEAPFVQGGGNIQQSFRMTGFEHQAAYDNDDVRNCTLYAIGKLLQGAKVL